MKQMTYRFDRPRDSYEPGEVRTICPHGEMVQVSWLWGFEVAKVDGCPECRFGEVRVRREGVTFRYLQWYQFRSGKWVDFATAQLLAYMDGAWAEDDNCVYLRASLPADPASAAARGIRLAELLFRLPGRYGPVGADIVGEDLVVWGRFEEGDK